MLRKKRTKPNSVWLSFLLLPLVMLTGFMQLKTRVFSLTLNPLNVSTNLSIVDDALLTQSVDGFITFENLPVHARFEISLFVSGFSLVDDMMSELPVLVVEPHHPYGRIDHVSSFGWYRLSARTFATGVITVRIQNFAIIEGRAYGFFIQELLMDKRGL